jgi:hypothetical protein
MKLISMTDFVLEQLNEENSRVKPMRDVFNSLENYANFLKQPLKLGIFVPCDNEGNVFQEPLKTDFIVEANTECGGWDYVDFDNNDNRYYNKPLFKIAEHRYKKAKEKVIFKDCEVMSNSKIKLGSIILDFDYLKINNIEDLVGLDLDLAVSF